MVHEEETEEEFADEEEQQPEIVDENATTIVKALEAGSLILGTDKVMNSLKNGHVKTVYLTKNCKKETADDIQYYAGLAKTEVITLIIDNEALGTVCRKPFSIAVVAIKK